MESRECFFSAEIREQGWSYVGCVYDNPKSYPPKCERENCPHFLSRDEARQIVMRELKNRK